MDSKKTKCLNVPTIRRSVMIANEKRKIKFDDTFENMAAPCATSTVEKQGYKNLIGSLPHNIMEDKNESICASYQSSLGILDIENFKGLEDDLLQKFDHTKSCDGIKSLSFNPQEISARSTDLLSPIQNKENVNPNETPLSPKYIKAKNDVEAIIEKAKRQSNVIDDILKSNSDPYIKNLRMSLQSKKQSILNDENKKTDSNSLWNNYTKELGFSFDGRSSSIRDSMFTSKINMSDEEMSWMKEHADLPVAADKFLNNSEILNENSLTSNNSFRSNFNAPFGDSKVSVGNYFQRRSEDINRILQARSPTKKNGHPPLYETTYIKENNEDDENNCETPKCVPSLSKDANISVSLNSDDTLANNFLSLTQIKNFVGKLETESPSVLIDHMLNVNKKTSGKKYDMKNPIPKIYKDSNGPKKMFDSGTNVFHSTKRDDLMNTKDDCDLGEVGDIANYNSSKLSPVKFDQNALHYPIPVEHSDISMNNQHNSKYSKNFNSCASSSSNSQELSRNHQSSMLKNSLKSTANSEITDNSSKSATTIIHVIQQPNKFEDPKLTENIPNIENTRSSFSVIKENQIDPESHSVNEKSFRSLFTNSDVSREIKDIMSPSSVNTAELQTPESGRYVKRLMDHFPPVKSNDKDGWISPRQAKINNYSKECIISVTPFKNDKNSFDMENINTSGSEYSVNVPIKGDWIKIISNEQDIIICMLHKLNFSIESLGSRWISINISIKEIFVDDQLFCGAISEIISVANPIPNILINANTKTECIIPITCWFSDRDIHIIFDVKLLDIVTKSTSSLNHCVKIHTCLPKIYVESLKCEKLNCLEFPIIPKGSEACIPIKIWNESKMNISIKLDIKNSIVNAFEIVNAEVVVEKDVEKFLEFYSQAQYSANVKQSTLQNVYSLPNSKRGVLIVLILFKALEVENDYVQKIDGILDILLATNSEERQPVSIEKISIMGRVGTSSLLIRSNQKSDTIVINQGSTESIEMFNSGLALMNYKLYFIDKCNQRVDGTLIPCEQNLFSLNKTSVSLDSGEKTIIKVSFPLCDVTHDIKRSLVFENIYISETVDIIGVSNSSRCQSQQSGYSVESVLSQSNETLLKCTKKELSWASLKIGDSKTQNIAFKNTSSKKIKIMATVIGEGFKMLSGEGHVSPLIFTLQPQECRTILLEFKAFQVGAHVGSLRIARRYSHSSNTEPRLLFKAPLHGIGGQSNLVFKDGVFCYGGSQGLPLGALNESGSTKQINFTIWNKGSATGFALFEIDLKWKYRNLGDEVYVTPSKTIIEPGESVRCAVTVPRRALSLARGKIGNTEAIATLVVLHGDESTRLRIKKIHQSEMDDDNMIETWNKKCQGKLKMLCSDFPNEDLNYCKINTFKEPSVVLWSLLDELQQKEVLITYDLDLDHSVARVSSDLDNTLHFQTVSEDLLNTTLTADSHK